MVVSLGDSYASGEGVPDVLVGQPGPTGSTDLWLANPDHDAVLCHRSDRNGHRLAVDEIAAVWPSGWHNVLFESFACTGATVTRGLLEPHFPRAYPEPQARSECHAFTGDPVNCQMGQVEQAVKWAAPDSIVEVDVVLLSIGGNDLGFGTLIGACATPTFHEPCQQDDQVVALLQNGCPDSPPSICSAADSLEDGRSLHVVGLSGLQERVSAALDEITAALDPDHILLIGYPDPLRDQNGQFCDNFVENFIVGQDAMGNIVAGGHHIGWGGIGMTIGMGASTNVVSNEETEWAFEEVLTPLNETLESAAAAHPRTTFVPGMIEATKNHGYCAGGERWFNTFKDSFTKQADVAGSLHPNQQGHHAYRDVIADALRDVLGLP